MVFPLFPGRQAGYTYSSFGEQGAAISDERTRTWEPAGFDMQMDSSQPAHQEMTTITRLTDLLRAMRNSIKIGDYT